MWDLISGIVGLVIGLVIASIVILILFVGRVSIFSICPVSTPPCTAAQYFNDPGDAILNGAQASQILFLDGPNLLYKRVPKVPGCIPNGSTQTITIKYPQYCDFTLLNGTTVTAKSTALESPAYTSGDIQILTSGNCVPTRATGASVTAGSPIVRWDPNATFNVPV